MSSLISIIIPTRNRVEVLARCLDALAVSANGDRCLEIIVVDDCSTDGTLQVVQRFAQKSAESVQLLRQQHPTGANAARNRALQIARGETIIFLDDDVIVPKGWLEALLEGLSKSGCPVVSGAVRLTVEGAIFGKHREEIQAHFGEILSSPSGFDGRIVPVLGNMAALRWVFDCARFDETLRPPVEEGDWLLRAGVRAAFVPEAWVWHHKTTDEMRVHRVLRGAWRRGSEGGWWLRERLMLPSHERLRLAFGSLKTSGRAFAHAAVQQCWGGVVVGMGEMAKALALVGLINRTARQPESWR